jgi:hypothetical protein
LTGALCALALSLPLATPSLASAPADPPAAATTLTAETMAVAPKPPGFRYAIIRDGLVDDISDTLLYVKGSKAAKTSRAVPIPKDRKLLATLIAGGTVDDLVKGTQLTVRYDPKGVVRPEIVIQDKAVLEVIDGAKVIDRGGNKLYVSMADGSSRGFEIEGGAAAWKTVVENGPVSALVGGARVRIHFDPSGRQSLRIELLDPPKPESKDKGCGCSVAGGGHVPAGSLLFLAVCFWAIARRRVVA